MKETVSFRSTVKLILIELVNFKSMFKMNKSWYNTNTATKVEVRLKSADSESGQTLITVKT